VPRPERLGLAVVLRALVLADAPACEVAALSEIPEALAEPLARLRRGWSLMAPGEPLEDARTRIERLARAERLPAISTCPVPSDRHAVIVAHGPSLEVHRAALTAARERLWIVAPFRTALRLAGGRLLPDVIVLAERDARPIHSTVAAWKTLPERQRACLSQLPFVVDPFAPPEVYESCPYVYGFDSGFGSGAALPFHGFGVLTALSLALERGHHRVALAGVNVDKRLAAALEVLACATDIECIDLEAGATSHRGWWHVPVDAYVAAPCARVDRRSVAAASWSPAEAAARLLKREVSALRALHLAIAAGLSALARLDRDAADREALLHLHSLMNDVMHKWPSHDELRTAVELAKPPFLLRLWTAHPVRREPFDRDRATRATATLVLRELADALSRCEREHVAPLETLLASARERVA
jgi:hypothetical protein